MKEKLNQVVNYSQHEHHRRKREQKRAPLVNKLLRQRRPVVRHEV